MFPRSTFWCKKIQEMDALELYLSTVKSKQKLICGRQSLFTDKSQIPGWAENPLVTPSHSTYFLLLE